MTDGTATFARELVRTSGRSMAPLIRDRSLVACMPVVPGELRPGDIIVFRREGRLVAHRIIGIRTGSAGQELREKGDNTFRGRWIPASSVTGRAVELIEGSAKRSLDAGGCDRRLRLLTRWSALEADACDAYLKLVARNSAFRAAGLALVPAALVALLFRRQVFRLLISAYPARVTVNPASAIGFVLGCFRSLFGGPRPESGSQESPDWERVLDAAGSLGVLPMLTAAGGAGMPAVFAAQARKSAYRAALNHDNAMKALGEISKVLAPVAPYAVLKGPYLYELLYRGRYPREYDDVDILIPRSKVREAVAALGAAGYEPVGGRFGMAFLLAAHFHVALDSARKGWPRLELHWSLVDRANLYRIPEEECFERLGRFTVYGVEFGALSPEDEFMYLCLHAAKHGVLNRLGLDRGYAPEWFCAEASGNRLTWYADIGFFLDRHMGSLDWGRMRARIAGWNVGDDVAACLGLLNAFAPGSLATEALARLGLPHGSAAPAANGRQRVSGSMAWAMRAQPFLLFRPIRLAHCGGLFFPSLRRLLAYHGAKHAWLAPFLYVFHPFHMALRLAGLAGTGSRHGHNRT
ncbi:MAG: hypothetical protein FJ224_08100 [Lentisphaerae bacterium]|nr:hypothetical protein [Lentisphaerota bacterium]